MTTVDPRPPHPSHALLDFEDDMPSAITHLPPASQAWAFGMHKAVREIRDDIRSAKKLIKLAPVVTSGLVGASVAIVEFVTWLLKHH